MIDLCRPFRWLRRAATLTLRRRFGPSELAFKCMDSCPFVLDKNPNRLLEIRLIMEWGGAVATIAAERTERAAPAGCTPPIFPVSAI